MQQILDAIILGLVQGLTEFIPVSSSGHLVVVGELLDFEYSGLAFNTVLDIGTLSALFLFFWRELWQLAHDAFLGGPKRKLAWTIAAATLPAVVVGFLAADLIDEMIYRSGHATQVVAAGLIWVGVLMYLVDRYAPQRLNLEGITFPRGLAVGFAQALALIPGTSRSGITITAGRLLGFDRVAATKYSFLLSAPVILGATVHQLLEPETLAGVSRAPEVYIAANIAAFVAGYAAIRFLLQYLSRHGLAPFAIYRVTLGVAILVFGIGT